MKNQSQSTPEKKKKHSDTKKFKVLSRKNGKYLLAKCKDLLFVIYNSNQKVWVWGCWLDKKQKQFEVFSLGSEQL